MRNIFFILFTLFLFSFSYGQVYVSGHILNAPKSAHIKITFYNNTIEYDEITLIDQPLDKNGRFLAQFEWEESKEVTLIIADEYSKMFLSPQDSLYITANFPAFDSTLHYEGKGKENNNYLATQIQYFFAKRAYRHSKNQDPFEYLNYVDSIQNANIALYHTFDTTQFTPDFKHYMQNQLKYRFIDPRWMFKVDFSQLDENGKPIYKDLPPKYYQFIWELDLNDQKSFDNTFYSIALQRYIYEAMHQEPDLIDSLPPIEAPFYVKRYHFIRNTFKGKILDFQLTKFMYHYLPSHYKNEYWEDLMQDYKEICQTQEYLNMIYNQYQRTIALSKGKDAPNFVLEDLTGDSIALNSLKGKVVLIDFWATWCAPCISAFPKMEALIQTFSDNDDVEILLINIGDSKERWKNYINKNKPEGLHLYANEKQTKALFKQYNFSGIPHYVLIDKNGKMVDANLEINEVLSHRIEILEKK